MHTINFVTVLLAALCGCSSPDLLPDADAMESARIYFERGAHEEAAELADSVLVSERERLWSPEILADAAWIAAESQVELGLDVKALKNYRRILETAPWSPNVVAIERRLFELGMRLLYDERYGGFFDSRGRGVEVMTLLQVYFRHSDLADDALRHVADHFAVVEEWFEASLTYEQLVDEYPDSEWAERALWLAAHCRLELVYAAGYNQNGMLKAQELLRRSLRVHPRGVSKADVEADLIECRELLSASHLIVGDFYASRGSEQGERLRLANAAILYPETKSGMAARERLLAKGLDPGLMAIDPGLSSIDQDVPARGPWSDNR
jgi:tetratricopeptide (TPR) repeat protein